MSLEIKPPDQRIFLIGNFDTNLVVGHWSDDKRLPLKVACRRFKSKDSVNKKTETVYQSSLSDFIKVTVLCIGYDKF
jgi:hypothetical protein